MYQVHQIDKICTDPQKMNQAAFCRQASPYRLRLPILNIQAEASYFVRFLGYSPGVIQRRSTFNANRYMS